MLSYPAYAQRRRQQRPTTSFNELEALADDLEYQAARARLAARRQTVAPPSRPVHRGPLGSFSRDLPYGLEEQYQPHYSRPRPSYPASRYPRFYEEEPEDLEYDTNFEEPFEPDYAFEEPSHFDFAPRRPRPVSSGSLTRHTRPSPDQLAREAHEARVQAYLARRREEEEAAQAIELERERQRQVERQQIRARAQLQAEAETKAREEAKAAAIVNVIAIRNARAQAALVARERAQAEAEARAHSTPDFESILSALGLEANLPHGEAAQRRTRPQPVPQPQSRREERPEVELLRQLGLIPPTEAPYPQPQQPSVPALVRRVAPTPKAKPQPQPQPEKNDSPSVPEEVLSILEAMGIPRSAVVNIAGSPVPTPQAQQSDEKAQPKTVRFASPGQAAWGPKSAPVLATATTAAAPQEPAPTKLAYTYAAPASAQRTAIPRPVSPSKDLPTPGVRTFSHIPPNPRDHARAASTAGRPNPQEVADLVEAIRRSLDKNEDVKASDVGAEAPAPASVSAQASSPVAASPKAPSTEAKSAPKSSPQPISISISSPTTSILDPVEQANRAIDAVEERFVNLNYDFAFPSHPEFSQSSSTSSSVPSLLYTPANASFHTYEHALNKLLTDLDAVESAGDEGVREKRRDVVGRIEGKLQELEALKLSAWGKVQAETGVEKPTAEAAAAAVVEEAVVVEKDDALASREEVHGYDIPAAVPEVEDASPVVVEDVSTQADEHQASAHAKSKPHPAEVEDSAPVDVVESEAKQHVGVVEKPAEVKSDDVAVPETLSSPLAARSSSSYPPAPPSSSYPPAPASSSASTYPPAPSPAVIEAEDLQAPSTSSSVSEPENENDAEDAISSTAGSSAVEIPSDVDLSDSDADETPVSRRPLVPKVLDDGDRVPPSMEESVHLEEATGFELL